MLRTSASASACVIGLNVMVAAVSMTAQAANETVTLACKGTATNIIPKTDDAKPMPHSMGIIVNFTARTVEGFVPLFPSVEFPVKIIAFNEVTVNFAGSDDRGWKISGSIGRVTGDVEAYSSLYSQKTNAAVSSTYYSLKCTPTQRMF